MTYVYGSTLSSTMDYVALDLADAGKEPIKTDAGVLAYSLNQLAVPIAKALRQGVVNTVPKAAEMMDYLQMLTRRHKEHVMQWITPVGVPVVNWAEGQVVKLVKIRSMGVEGILFSYNDGKYNTRSAANGVVPNFVHSMDSAHLCMTINECTAQGVQVLPIHDSFATHPCDVPKLHEALRSTFAKMYTEYNIEQFLEFNGIDTEEYPKPNQGNLDLNSVLDAPYMFC